MKKTKKIKINLNGRALSIPLGTTVYKIVKKIKAQPSKVAIELNSEIIKKKKISKIHLKDKDKLEIVHFID